MQMEQGIDDGWGFELGTKGERGVSLFCDGAIDVEVVMLQDGHVVLCCLG